MGSSFVRTLSTLKVALTVGHVAEFPVFCCRPGHEIQKLRHEISNRQKDFSHVPVRDEQNRLLGVICRDSLTASSRGTAKDHLHIRAPLLASHVVSADAPLRDLLPKLRAEGFLLVRAAESGFPDGISGIVNHADLQKTPVRLLLFAQLAEVETRLRSRLAHDAWEGDPACARFVREAQSRKKRHRASEFLSLLAYLNIAEICELAHGRGVYPGIARDGLLSELRMLYNIRNSVMHHQEHVGPGDRAPRDPLDTVQRAIDAFALVERFINALGEGEG